MASAAVCCTCTTQEGVGSDGSTPAGRTPAWITPAVAQTVGITMYPSESAA